MAYKNVIVVGARGKLGSPLVQALLASTEPKFRVTALARASSDFTAPSSVVSEQGTQSEPLPNPLYVIKVDFTRSSDLVRAFTGQDVAIFAITAGNELAETSKILIEAAIQAGVQRIIPSEFGIDENPVLVTLFGSKAVVKAQLEEAAKEGNISYTIFQTGPWFDFAFNLAFGFDLAAKTATLYNGGTHKFHTTTLDSIASAVIRVLSDPAPFTNKVLHMHDFVTSQREILAITERVTGQTFAITDVNAEELGEKSLNALKRGEFNQDNIMEVIRSNILGPSSAARWDENDESAALGLGGKSLEEEIRKLL